MEDQSEQLCNAKILMDFHIKVELWLASQEITSSRLRNVKKETIDGVPQQITKEIVEPLNGGSYLNNSDCISSSTTSKQEEAVHELNHAEPSCSTEAEVSSTTSLTPSYQTEKLKDL